MSTVQVYWRPGCIFCSMLRRGIHKVQLPVEEINIWEDPSAAATVRSVADGNETVPTVVVGARALVNPTLQQVLDVVAEEAPELLPGTSQAG
jgi:mycoredoxin